MSYYYKYNFVSPEPIYSIVKEELKSYFDTGAVDDLMFPTYLFLTTSLLLEKLGCVLRFLSYHTKQLTHFILKQLAKQQFK